MYFCFIVINGFWLNIAHIISFEPAQRCGEEHGKGQCTKGINVRINPNETRFFSEKDVSADEFKRKVTSCAASAE